MAKRKCKNCGRTFDAKVSGDVFCSPLCRATGFFVGGGGDTSKPGVSKPTETVHPQKPIKGKKNSEKFDRVRKMFDLPPEKRWEVSKDFSEDERSFARRLERRRLMEEDRIFREWDWDAESEEEMVDGEGTVGESDDGTV